MWWRPTLFFRVVDPDSFESGSRSGSSLFLSIRIRIQTKSGSESKPNPDPNPEPDSNRIRIKKKGWIRIWIRSTALLFLFSIYSTVRYVLCRCQSRFAYWFQFGSTMFKTALRCVIEKPIFKILILMIQYGV
jgi:hypothetical protein